MPISSPKSFSPSINSPIKISLRFSSAIVYFQRAHIFIDSLWKQRLTFESTYFYRPIIEELSRKLSATKITSSGLKIQRKTMFAIRKKYTDLFIQLISRMREIKPAQKIPIHAREIKVREIYYA